jgi:xanthine dehydrogenase accessory factor
MGRSEEFMRDIFVELVKILEQKQSCTYCCVVQTRGSTPQKAGASMLVFPDGSQRGTLGGGCVEAEVKQRALQAMADDSGPEIRTFVLDDDYGWDDGLICGGRMAMLIDPVPAAHSPHLDYYRKLMTLVDAGEGCTQAVSHEGEAVGSRFLFGADGALISTLGKPASVAPGAALIDVRTRPGPYESKGIAYLPCLPTIRLLIVGGGHVGAAVAKQAGELNFNVWAVDDRADFASRERFPSAQRLIVGDIGESLRGLVTDAVDASTYCIIVTRGHSHDEEALYHLVSSRAAYVGMIGSKRKIKLIYEDLVAKGIDPALLERVHAPLGLDIGSQTVAEISISIVAELIAFRNRGTTEIAPRPRIRPGNVRS